MTKFWLVLTMMVAAMAGAKTPSDEQLTLTVQVFDETGLRASALRSVEAEVTRIFALSGIVIKWNECPLLCNEPSDPRIFALQIRQEDDRVVRTTDSALGFAMPLDSRAYYFAAIYPRVQEFARRRDEVGPLKVLAAVIAHELGHLLFRSNMHGSGIMHARWTEKELKDMNQSRLVFTAQQSMQLREGLMARTAGERASGK